MEAVIFWIVLPIAILSITNPVAASVFIALLEKSRWRGLGLLWLSLGLAAALLGVLIAYTPGNVFPGLGCSIAALTPLVAVVTFLTFRFRAKRVYAALGGDENRRRWFMAGTLLIPLLQLSAPAVSVGYVQFCDALNRQAAGPLIDGLEKYKADTGSYYPADALQSPYQTDLGFLAPRYVPSIPSPACVAAFFNRLDPYHSADDTWSLYYCNNSPSREVLLMAPIIGSDSRQLYNLLTGHWSGGSSFDGYCSHLR